MASESKEVQIDFSPYLKVYKDGTVERFFGSPYVPPSLDDPITHISTKDIKISSNVSARIYLPKITDPNKKLPVLVYYHGGAFCLESALSLFDYQYLNQLVPRANALTVSVEYRLAPEHPLPAAYEDSWAALQWVASHSVKGSEIDSEKEPWLINYGDFSRVYLGGGSAGGNIVHNMAMKAGEEGLIGGVKILGAFMSCPCFCDSKITKESDFGSARLWGFVYPSAPGGTNNPLINPFADGVPNLAKIGCQKIFVSCAEKDELRDVDLSYVEALKKSGWNGELELVDVEGEDHCFEAFDPSTEKAQNLISKIASFIKG
ncbi:OLC1v1020127C1 [Oldenlandia corymbosa var. corymbosa]|uniref:OLC1v1020127C1 n=1 Tax=Oldenlandia corymbosa var. corymbosa TaxID=529605 RepID=A0AAV1EFX4_OLDCO|nr:OLC1v1020127C1 [Oldenlandia corymbosa var. corymbosa]